MITTAKRKLTFVGTALALSLSMTSAALAGCNDHAGPKVDWSGCDKSNADLSGNRNVENYYTSLHRFREGARDLR